MTDTQVIEQAERAATESATDRFLESLGERIGGHAKAEAVFGQPIVKNGLTVVPVARVRYAFGGGSGTAPDFAQTEDGSVARTGSGSGGGGGVTADLYRIPGDPVRKALPSSRSGSCRAPPSSSRAGSRPGSSSGRSQPSRAAEATGRRAVHGGWSRHALDQPSVASRP